MKNLIKDVKEKKNLILGIVPKRNAIKEKKFHEN
jgi:hypothetical protein